jgi:asparagine synthetase B (glutamine-hydrolysing)
MLMLEDKLTDIIEYAIYHDNIDKKNSIYGIKNTLLSRNFFKITKKNFIFEEMNEILDYSFKKSLKRIKGKSILLCSGGVDSSLLTIYLKKFKKNFFGLHTNYPNQKLNDLSKIKSLKKFIDFNYLKFNIGKKKYFNGMKYSWSKGYYGNTYAPTIYSLFYKEKTFKSKYLLTGSGPDELFYGLEKYSFKDFNKVSHLKTNQALEILDSSYNLENYKKILNNYGKKLLMNIYEKRRKLYRDISHIEKDILNAQRILAYVTVTNQHAEMFDNLAKKHKMKHIAPFLEKEFIKYCMQIDLRKFLNTKESINKDANSGKIPLKIILSNYTSKKHAYSNKVGFYSPISEFINHNLLAEKEIENFNLDKLGLIFDSSKLKKLIKIEKSKRNYFLYSLINVNDMLCKIS